MPLLIEFKLKAMNDGYLAPFTGGYVRGFFLESVRKLYPGLAAELHESRGIKPYAIRPLRPINKRMNVTKGGWKIDKGDKLIFNISILSNAIESEILKAILDVSNIAFKRIKFDVDEISVKKETFSELSAKKFEGEIKLRFVTPTCFKDPNQSFPYIFPRPDKLLLNLLKIWNTYAPIEYKLEKDVIMDAALNSIIVREYELKTREVNIDVGAKIVGFKGQCTWIIIDDEAGGVISPLLALSKYSNVGYGRTYGLGVIEVKGASADK